MGNHKYNMLVHNICMKTCLVCHSDPYSSDLLYGKEQSRQHTRKIENVLSWDSRKLMLMELFTTTWCTYRPLKIHLIQEQSISRLLVAQVWPNFVKLSRCKIYISKMLNLLSKLLVFCDILIDPSMGTSKSFFEKLSKQPTIFLDTRLVNF